MTKSLHFIILAFLLLSTGLLSACGGHVPIDPAATAQSENRAYLLGVGDLVRVTVYGQDEITGDYNIDSNGKIALPLVQNISASGLTLTQLKANIANALSPKYLKNPKISLEIVQYRDIYILGEVRSPGKYAYVPNMTILQAVAVAGGHTYRAQENWAEVSRTDQTGLQTFNAGTKSFVEPGDTIIVKRRWF